MDIRLVAPGRVRLTAALDRRVQAAVHRAVGARHRAEARVAAVRRDRVAVLTAEDLRDPAVPAPKTNGLLPSCRADRFLAMAKMQILHA